MPARLSVTVPLSGLAKVRRAKVSLPLVSALQGDPKYATELPAPTPRDVDKPPRNPSLPGGDRRRTRAAARPMYQRDAERRETGRPRDGGDDLIDRQAGRTQTGLVRADGFE
jgi:hypothetical protein